MYRSMRLYREVAVWKRIDDKGAVKFNCLEDIDLHQFAVQSADFYTAPIKNAVIDDFEKQFVELFIQIDPAERRKWFDSIEQAVAAHEDNFDSFAKALIARERTDNGS
jgi:hypothetical protein